MGQAKPNNSQSSQDQGSLLIYKEGNCRLWHDPQNVGDDALVEPHYAFPLQDQPEGGGHPLVLHRTAALALLQARPHHLQVIKGRVGGNNNAVGPPRCY